MSDEHNELLRLTQSVRELVDWDAQDGAMGYLLPPPLEEAPRPAAPARRAPAPPAAPARQVVKPVPAPAPAAMTRTLDAGLQEAGLQEAGLQEIVWPGGTPPSQLERPDLDDLRKELGPQCRRCKLCDLGRNQVVFGEGDPNADLLFAGEGPGFHEDRTGRPFVGRAGALLEKMIIAMGLTREQVYICNVVKCRPPKTRDPETDEITACEPFMKAQIRAIQPKVIVTLGRFAAQTLLNTSEPMGRMRGQFVPYLGTQVMPTYHPAYLLRNPADKRKAWDDLQQVMAALGLNT